MAQAQCIEVDWLPTPLHPFQPICKMEAFQLNQNTSRCGKKRTSLLLTHLLPTTHTGVSWRLPHFSPYKWEMHWELQRRIPSSDLRPVCRQSCPRRRRQPSPCSWSAPGPVAQWMALVIMGGDRAGGGFQPWGHLQRKDLQRCCRSSFRTREQIVNINTRKRPSASRMWSSAALPGDELLREGVNASSSNPSI